MIPISVCIIGKDEEQHIEKCLSPLAPFPFELVYVNHKFHRPHERARREARR